MPPSRWQVKEYTSNAATTAASTTAAAATASDTTATVSATNSTAPCSVYLMQGRVFVPVVAALPANSRSSQSARDISVANAYVLSQQCPLYRTPAPTIITVFDGFPLLEPTASIFWTNS
eukprot:GHVT01033856.1.p2 GENE.GHVT01033856.1~~GHVT01033856.1.p2  ORF type:complete len:119 (-),score=17.92 GHVT01033856.1:2544-2900(-)